MCQSVVQVSEASRSRTTHDHLESDKQVLGDLRKIGVSTDIAGRYSGLLPGHATGHRFDEMEDCDAPPCLNPPDCSLLDAPLGYSDSDKPKSQPKSAAVLKANTLLDGELVNGLVDGGLRNKIDV